MGAELYLAAGVACVAAALMHSLLGELARRAARAQPHGGDEPADHAPGEPASHGIGHRCCGMMIAGLLISAGLGHAVDRWLLACIGGVHLALGLFDAVVTRGRHLGWPLLVLIGGLTLLALLQTR
jgi:hypothetical protein